MQQVLKINISKLLDSPYQGRLFTTHDISLAQNDQNDLLELQKSIKKDGLLQPILLRHSTAIPEKYEIIDGHRRVLAFKNLSFTHIDAIVKDLTDQQTQVQTIIANLQRKNLSVIENAIAFEKCIKNGLYKSKAQLSKAIGKDETYVGDMINLLKMDTRIIEDLIANKSINDVRMLRTIRNAYPLAENKKQNHQQYQLYLHVVDNKLSRKQLYKHIEMLKAMQIIDDNNLSNNINIDNDKERNELINAYKSREIEKKIGPRKIKTSFDLTGLDPETKYIIAQKIEIWIDKLNIELKKSINK